ncbi:hypothetical protein [Leptolyngbya sp. AS-A6]|uniref:nSTAND1 domain-containing NTPase n=1 Tax=Leptolyngbya sp. AS-A6 TaxID=2933913 RepID=UPI0032983587
MRLAHGDLLKLYRETDDKDALVSNIRPLIKKGRETGALIDNDDDRLAAQSLLDYWVSVLLRSGHSIDNATLAEFDINLAPELNEADCPYLGLDAFKETDANLFYGRQRLAAQLIESLAVQPLLVVIGASGSGKSSVVRGGLIPKLKAGALPNSDQWHYFAVMVPGSNPLETLVNTLSPDPNLDRELMRQQVHQLETRTTNLPTLIRQGVGDRPTVLVIDQFEEIFTLCPDKVRDIFIENLVALVQASSSPKNYLILTMRSDFETQVAKLPQFWALFEASHARVLPLDAGELREAIEAPAEQVGLKFEAGVVDQLIADVLGEPAALPLLQFMLLRLWEHRDRNRVTYHAYRQLGGGRGALAHSADEFYTNLIPEDQETAKRILLKMVRPSTGLEVTNNRIRQQELHQLGIDPGRINRVLDKLCTARLVRRTPGVTPDDTQIEVAHEALIRNWPRLIEWLDDERVSLRQRLRLTDTAKEWEARNYPKAILLRGELLEEAQQYHDLNSLEKEFVKFSCRESQRRKIRDKAIFISSIIGILAMLSIGFAWSLNTYRLKEKLEVNEDKLRLANENMVVKNQELEARNSALEAQVHKTNEANNRLAETQQEAMDQGVSLTPDIQVDKGSAQASESAGFEALLAGNLSQAKDYFGQAYEAFPTYHNVDEIYNTVLTQSTVDRFNSADAADQKAMLRQIYQTILDNYAWGAPREVIDQMETRLSTTAE